MQPLSMVYSKDTYWYMNKSNTAWVSSTNNCWWLQCVRHWTMSMNRTDKDTWSAGIKRKSNITKRIWNNVLNSNTLKSIYTQISTKYQCFHKLLHTNVYKVIPHYVKSSLTGSLNGIFLFFLGPRVVCHIKNIYFLLNQKISNKFAIF